MRCVCVQVKWSLLDQLIVRIWGRNCLCPGRCPSWRDMIDTQYGSRYSVVIFPFWPSRGSLCTLVDPYVSHYVILCFVGHRFIRWNVKRCAWKFSSLCKRQEWEYWFCCYVDGRRWRRVIWWRRMVLEFSGLWDVRRVDDWMPLRKFARSHGTLWWRILLTLSLSHWILLTL